MPVVKLKTVSKQRKLEKRKVLRKTPRPVEGINLVEGAGKPVLQELVAQEIGGSEGKAVWIDVGNESSTYALASADRDLMEDVLIGRAFTPFQHLQIIENLDKYIREDTEVLVAPNFSSLYVSSGINRWEAMELFEESWEMIKNTVERNELKLLVSVEERDSEIAHSVLNDVEKHLKVEKTSEGVKFSSDEFKNDFYSGRYFFQTTLSYWDEVIG